MSKKRTIHAQVALPLILSIVFSSCADNATEPDTGSGSGSGATLFLDDFESETIGELPSQWTIRYSGDALEVVSSPVYAGSKAFMLRGAPSWVGSVTHDIDITVDFVLEAYFYVPSGGLGYEQQGGIAYNDGYMVKFAKNSTSTFQIRCNNSNYGNYNCDTWYKIEIRVDNDAERFAVYLDGNQVTIEDAGNFDSRGIELWSSNLNDQGANRTVYFDDISVTECDYDFEGSGGGGAQDSSIVTWGLNTDGQCDVPSPNEDFQCIAGGMYHSFGLKENGSIVAWGNNNHGQCNVPSPNSNYISMAGGWEHSLGLRSDGSIVAWGNNTNGQCNIPSPNSNFVEISAGNSHSLCLRSNGSIEACGNNASGQCDVPSPNEDFVGLSAGSLHSLGLKNDGSIVAWGANYAGQCNVPTPNTNFIAVAAGGNHSIGLRNDGSIVVWGSNQFGECIVPSPNTDFITIKGGFNFCLAEKSTGSIIAWGRNSHGQCDVPEIISDIKAIAAGGFHCLILLNN